MTVRSSEITDSPPKVEVAPTIRPSVRRGDLSWHAVGAVALALGVSLWLVGARFTVLGGPQVLETILGLFQINLRIPLPTGWPLLALTIFVGATVSKVEFGCHPRRSFFTQSLLMGVILFIIWAVVNAGDVASTYIGVTTVSDESWPATRWLATTTGAAGLWTLFLSYIPELFMIGGWRWLINGRF